MTESSRRHNIDDESLEREIAAQSGDPILSAVRYYGGTDDRAHVVPMREKVRAYAKCFVRMLYDKPNASPPAADDYAWAVREALDFCRQEREGKFAFSNAFAQEHPHTPFVYLVAAAQMYASVQPQRDIEAVLKMAVEEMNERRAQFAQTE
jgi:hypothetical protein